MGGPMSSGRKLTVEGDVVMGNLVNTTTSEVLTNFLATDATGFEKIIIGIADSEDCSDDALAKAKKFPIQEPLDLSNVQGEGWRAQSITEVQDANTTLPVSLADLINGVESGLAVYLLSSDEALVGCAYPKKLDEAAANMYNELIFGPSGDEAVMGDTASGRKNGVFVVVSAIAAVGIAAVLGDVLAL